ncbi:IS701 family transposase [Micromonospora craniellae]
MLVELRERVDRLEAENAELRRRLGLNSSNSSKPPSSDGLARPRPQSGKRGGSGRSRGKQPGAPGSTLELAADPDQVVQHRPDRCVNPACGIGLDGGREYGRQRRQVVELPERRPVVTEHQLVAVECAGCGQVSEPAAPAGVTGRVQYGTDVKAAAVYARAGQFLPFGRVAALMADLLGVRVSTGFVHQVVTEAARRLGPFVSRLAALLQVQDVLHADETPARVGPCLPKSWTGDRDRCRAAAIPEEVEFATKPQQAQAMVERAIEAWVPFSWFTADEAYGQNPGLRGWLEDQDIAYVMATRCDDGVPSGLHTTLRVDELIARVRAGAWQRLSCGDGARGPRRYDWARVPIRRTFAHGRRGWVLARRSISDPGEIAYYVCFGRRGTRLRELVRVAGSRWSVEESFQTAKNEVGLVQCQVRRYDAWYAHITLAMAAAAFLVVTRAAEASKGASPQTRAA